MHRAACLLLLLLAGCTEWVREVRPLDQAILPVAPPRRVRLTLQDRTTLELYYPVLTQDSILGAPWFGAANRAGVARPLVAQLDVRRSSGARTMLLVGAIFVGGKLVLGPLIEDTFTLGGMSWNRSAR